VAPVDLEAAPLVELSAWLEGSPEDVPGAALEAAGEALRIAAGQDVGEAPGLYQAPRALETLTAAVKADLPAVSVAVAEAGDAGLARWLEALGSKAAAAQTRKDGAGLTVARSLCRVALALWWERVRARTEREAIQRWPGIPLPLVDSARVGAWGKPRAVDTPVHGRVLVDGAGTTLAALDVDRVPCVPADLLDKLEAWGRSGADLLGSLHAHRLLRWLIWEAHDRHQPGHAPILEVAGGWQALARAVGCRSNKADEKVRDVVCCLDAHRFNFPDGSAGRLLSLSYRPARGRGSRAVVSLTPGAPLLPGYVFQLRIPDRKVVPVLAELPPMVGRERDHGVVAELHWRVLVDMRRRCREMVGDVHGVDLGLPLSPRDWRGLADLARVPSRTLVEALQRWTRDGSDGPAFLRRVSQDRFTLASAHDGARRVLLHYGWKEARGSERGKRSARARGGTGPVRRRKGQR